MSSLVSENGRDLSTAVFAKPAVVCDLDGTIRFNPDGEYINGPEDIALYRGVIEALWRYRNEGYLVFGVTNQGGVAHGHKSPEGHQAEMDRTRRLAGQQHEDGWPFHQVKACFYMASGSEEEYAYRSLRRKPRYGMLAVLEDEAQRQKGASYIIDWDESLMIGDRDEDMACAQAAGVTFYPASDWHDEIERSILE